MSTPATTLVMALADLKNWTWRAGLAVALIVLAYVIPRLVGVSEGVTDILEQGNMIGLALLLAEIARARQETPPPPPSSDQRGHMATPLLYALGIIAVCACVWAWAGCVPSRDIRTTEDMDVQTWDGPPCRVIVKVGSEVVLDGESTKRCKLAPPGTF